MAKILLVEDDTNLSEIYQARMEAEGYEVVSAADGESALAIAAKEKPDLIISDVMMPKISGFEMLDILRNTPGLKDTPVIMLTALGQSDDKGRAEQLGADRYLVKSQVTLEDIVNAAHALLEGAPATPAAPAATAAAVAAVAVNASTPADASLPVVATDTTSATEPAAPTGPLAATEPAQGPVDTATVTVAPVNDDSAPVTADSDQPAELPVIPVAAPPASPAETDQPAEPTQAASTTYTATNPDTPIAVSANEPAEQSAPPPPGVPVDTTIDPENSPNFPQGGSPTAEATAPAESTAAIATATVSAETVAAIASSARSTAQESDSLKHQIEGFEHRQVAPVNIPPATSASVRQPIATQPAASPPAVFAPSPSSTATRPPAPQPVATTSPIAAAPTVDAPTPTPQPAAVTVAPSMAHAIDEKVVARAIEELLNKSPQAAQAPKPQHGRVLQTTSTIDTSSASNIDRPQKKVISPIPHPPTPSLAELVAMEEAKEMAAVNTAQNFASMAVAPATGPQAVLPAASIPAPPPELNLSAAEPAVLHVTDAVSLQTAAEADPTVPNIVLPGVITPTATTAQAPAPQPATAAKPVFDPNSIAL